ncbi:MAG: DUF1549 and DUF1553 domain-containing protein [Gemmataceae bacterium]
MKSAVLPPLLLAAACLPSFAFSTNNPPPAPGAPSGQVASKPAPAPAGKDAPRGGRLAAAWKASGEPPCYQTDVAPLIQALGCSRATCHGGGRGGLKLSLFGTLPQQDRDALIGGGDGKWVDRKSPVDSPLVRKLTGKVRHGGGPLVEAGSAEQELLTAWLAGGAPFKRDNTAALTGLVPSVPTATVARGGTLQLRTTAVYANGSRRDVTALTRLRAIDPDLLDVEADGVVVARAPGQTHVIVRYLDRTTVVRVVVPRPLAAPFPPFPAANRIDELVAAKLKELGVPPSELCTDQEFLRRVYLDVIGVLPTAPEARAFLADPDPAKRSKLIDRLLARPEYVDFWSLKWGDLLRVKSEQDSNLWPNGVQAYHRWIRQSVATDKPYDQFARELLVSAGSNFRSPPANFYRGVRFRAPESYAAAAALTFMGVRLNCAQCHVHPTEHWTPDDHKGMTAFFAQIQIKNTREWKEEIVFVDPNRPGRQAKPLDGPVLTIAPEEDARVKFADWLTAPGNPYFAPNIANRVWYWLLGRGIIHEPDDIRPTNPPSNPPLLAYLADELVQHRYQLKHLFRLILNSRTYQLSSRPNGGNAIDNPEFARYRPKRLGAEQLSDAIGQVTGVYDTLMSQVPEPWTWMPDGTRAAQLADGSISTPLLNMFGRPERNTGYESERSNAMTSQQALYLLDSWEIRNKVHNGPTLHRLLTMKASDRELIDEVYLLTLSRPASAAERDAVLAHLTRLKSDRRTALADLLWALINSTEFLTIR